MNKQVKDDPAILKLMLADISKVPAVYLPTNYWKVYEKRFLPVLQKVGLKNFRKNYFHVFSGLGATDFFPPFGYIDIFRLRPVNNKILRKLPYWSAAFRKFNKLLNKYIPVSTREDKLLLVKRLMFNYANLYGKSFGAKPLELIDCSLYGNPAQQDLIKIDDRTYTYSMIDHYLRYVYVSRFIDFEKINIIVELGSGAGKQVEILKKLYPHITFVLFDIPPQLYICQQYLKSVFPNSVVPYEKTRFLNRLPKSAKGKIYIFGNWKIQLMDTVKVDLFWNAASFQEMEPNIVANYLEYVNRNARAAYIQAIMYGKEIAKREGVLGVLKRTKLKHYKNGLTNFKLVDLSGTAILEQSTEYSNSFWGRT